MNISLKNSSNSSIMISQKVVIFVVLFLMSHFSLFCYSKDLGEKNILNGYLSESMNVEQKMKISGRVVDKNGFPLPGATVTVKGEKGVGVVTDAEGKYTISCDMNSILIYSFVGTISVEEIAREANNVTVTLEDDVVTLEELQVVAFGKQKKESVVSAITTISPSELRVPSSNITTAFAGRMAGVVAYQRSGEPGLDNAEFFIRGITTFSAEGKKDPLILIDGIEMSSNDLARINVDDIASFSVMKDATSAALYGARGANGVILVTTKLGVEDKVKVNIRGELSSSSNSELVELADPITYMTLHNEAVRARSAVTELPYSKEKIYETQLGTNPIMYPAVDWYKYLIKDHTSNQRVNVNLTGGGRAVQYYLAANYQHDTGIIKETDENKINNNININRLQVRSNVTINITPRTEAVIRAYGTFDSSKGPKSGGSQVFSMARNASPVRFLPYYPKDEANEVTKHILFGMYESEGSYFTNPLAQVVSGFKESSSSMMLLQLEFEHTFDKELKGLFTKGIFNVKRDSYYDLNRSYKPFYYAPAATTSGSYVLHNFNPDGGTEYLDFNFGSKSVVNAMYGELRLGYNKVFNEKHELNALLVGTLRTETDASASSIQESLPRRNISSAGRLSYGFDSRYLCEFNFGYNGSERFAKNNRFGFFPSVGIGWIVSNENFWSNFKNVVSLLKLKATYGKVGNDQIGSLSDRFFYLSQVNMNGPGYVFGEELSYYRNGIQFIRYGNNKITWEIAKKTNLGVEASFFNDLTILVDYFTETRENILQTRSDIPTTMGLQTIPQSNIGVAEGSGVELELKYQKSFNKDLWLIINGSFTYASSKYKEYEEPDYSRTPWLSHIGNKINQPYGYIAERLFIDQEEVNNSPTQLFGVYTAGDIKYKDINNDGKIDSYDMVPIGYPTVPEIIYGTGFSFGFKAMDISLFFQGSARSSFFISPSQITPFISKGQRALLKYIADDHWSETNRDLNAFWPRLSEYAISNNNQTSTYWLRDGSFIRLKSAEIGYTLPQKISNKFSLDMFRFYLSGSNLFVWSKFKMWDPEMAGNGLGYPIQRVINLGVNINF